VCSSVVLLHADNVLMQRVAFRPSPLLLYIHTIVPTYNNNGTRLRATAVHVVQSKLEAERS
jgi:hypothetical protein